MSEEKKQYGETKKVFLEYYIALDKANSIKENPSIPQTSLMIEYMQLVESYEKLLKTTVRISKLGDMAQNKLMKYKELIETLSNLE